MNHKELLSKSIMVFTSHTQIKPNYIKSSLYCTFVPENTLQWRHDGLESVSNHQPHHCLLSRLFGRRSKKTSKLRVTGLCAGNSAGTGEFPAQMASNAENVSIWWRHHENENWARNDTRNESIYQNYLYWKHFFKWFSAEYWSFL